MNNSDKLITLEKDSENTVANYVITMFSIIGKAKSPMNVESNGNKIIIKHIEKENILEFDENYDNLWEKIMLDFLRDSAKSKLDLNKEESELFKKCSHVAYYILTENKIPKGDTLSKKFKELHENMFRNF